MEYKPDKKEFSIAISFGILGIFIFIIFAVLTFIKVGSVTKEISNSGMTADGIETSFKIKKQVNELNQEIKTLDSFFIKNNEEAYFIEEIESLAKSFGIKIGIESASVKNTEEQNDFKDILKLAIKYEGKWKNVIRFLKSIQNMNKATILGSIKLNLSANTPNFWFGTAEVTAYKLK